MPLLHSQILGEGPPMIILHGFLGMSDNWKTLGTQYAEAGLQVHLIDQRNHGKSFHSEAFNYDLLANDVREYVAYHKLRPAIVLGHSMGGKTAMEFACKYPELTSKLIVADIAPKFYPPHHQWIIDGLNAIDLTEIKSRGEAEEQLGKYIKEAGIRQFLLKNLYWADKTRLAFRFNLKVLKSKMEEVGENIGATAQFQGPTLFIKGDRSEYVTDDDLGEIKRHFPMSRVTTIENAGHWLHAENPKQFFEQTLQFINS